MKDEHFGISVVEMMVIYSHYNYIFRQLEWSLLLMILLDLG